MCGTIAASMYAISRPCPASLCAQKTRGEVEKLKPNGQVLCSGFYHIFDGLLDAHPALEPVRMSFFVMGVFDHQSLPMGA